MLITTAAPESLDDATAEALRDLVARCNAAEGLDLPLPAEVGAGAGLILARLDGQLAGAAYVSYAPEFEICLCVDPASRRRGVGRALLQAVRDNAVGRRADALLLVADVAADSGRAFAAALGAELSYAEHRMDLDLPAVPPPPAPLPGLHIRAAGAEDTQAIVGVLVAAFGDPPPMVERFVAERMASRSHRFLLGELAGRPAGALRLILDDGWTYITTFGVLPELQGRGVGRRMLLHALGALLAEGQEAIRIEVDTTNAAAIGLYQSCGFRTGHTFSYLMLAGR